MADFVLEEITKREKAELENDFCAKINIKYPRARSENEKLCKRFNDFYSDVATAFLGFAKGKMAKHSHTSAQVRANGAPYGAVMSWFVSYESEKCICIICDFSVFDTVNTYEKRICNIWNKQDFSFMGARDFLKCDRASVKNYLLQIEDMIVKNNAGFELLPNCIFNFKKLFSLQNFCLTSNGPAFFYQKNTLFSAKEGCPTFLVHEERKE